jgi:limonene-1,2-epoxide hydrolase
VSVNGSQAQTGGRSRMSTTETPVDLVRRFCEVWADGDLDAIMAFFTDDAVYHNIPVAPVTGRDAIRETIAGFTAGVDKLEFRVRNIAASGDVVMTERVDVFVTGDRAIELPVMGTFEVSGGRITAWRDYFDLNQFMSQLAPA